jgi:hypothetical protein
MISFGACKMNGCPLFIVSSCWVNPGLEQSLHGGVLACVDGGSVCVGRGMRGRKVGQMFTTISVPRD